MYGPIFTVNVKTLAPLVQCLHFVGCWNYRQEQAGKLVLDTSKNLCVILAKRNNVKEQDSRAFEIFVVALFPKLFVLSRVTTARLLPLGCSRTVGGRLFFWSIRASYFSLSFRTLLVTMVVKEPGLAKLLWNRVDVLAWPLSSDFRKYLGNSRSPLCLWMPTEPMSEGSVISILATAQGMPSAGRGSSTLAGILIAPRNDDVSIENGLEWFNLWSRKL